MGWWNRNRKIIIKSCIWKGDEEENQSNHWSLSVLIFCRAGIWQVFFTGTGGYPLIILHIWCLRFLFLPITFHRHIRSLCWRICLPNVSQDSQWISYLNKFEGLKIILNFKQSKMFYLSLYVCVDLCLLWSEYLHTHTPHIHMWKSPNVGLCNAQCYDIRKQSTWEVFSSWGWTLHE